MAITVRTLQNFDGGEWIDSTASNRLRVLG
jgi:hypothetical protein